MTGSAGDERRPSGPPPALLTAAAADALRAADGRAGGAYLRSRTPGVLRLAVLAGLPGPLFRPWWRVHVDRPFPVADVHRTGVPVVLANATEAMRRYPQLAAGLPFQFGTLTVPITARGRAFGVMAVLRAAAADAAEVLAARERLARVADGLAAQLLRLEADGHAATWDDEPVCVRPPVRGTAPGRVGRFSWDPATDTVDADERARALFGLPPGELPGTLDALARAVEPTDAHRLPDLLHETARGCPPPLPIEVRTMAGGLRLLELWAASDGGSAPVTGVLLDPGTGALADGAADLLPEGVFCVDRLGLVVYANPRAAHFLGVDPAELAGRPLLDAVPWLSQPTCEEHLRVALLSPEPVHFHVRRPADGPRVFEGDWLSMSVYPGADLLTCTAVPASRVPTPAHAEAVAPDAAGIPSAPAPHADASTGPLYRPALPARSTGPSCWRSR